MQRLARSAALLFIAASCAPGETPSVDATGASSSAIVGGVAESGEPAVVVVKVLGGVGLCTGTLISPRVVLTAKHCAQAAGAERPYPASAISVGFGDDADTTINRRVIAVSTTPGRYTSTPTAGLGGELVGVDIAALTLLEPIADVTPIAVARTRPEPGTAFTAVGFGLRPDGEDGLKYSVTSEIERMSEDVLYTSMTICSGDSGGPAIIEGAPRSVVGVASFGERDRCPSRNDGYNLVEPFLGLIDAAIIAAGDCPGISDELCNSVDDDCDGTIDEGCAVQGEACTADDECAFAQVPTHMTPLENPARCEATPAGQICTRGCDPAQRTTSCAAIEHPFTDDATPTPGVYCATSEGCGGRCMPGEAGAAAIGQACADDADCASLLCLDPGDGERRCLSPCRGGAAFCPLDEVCAAGDDSCGACIPTRLFGSARGLGEMCTVDTDCRSGVCHDGTGVSLCSAPCAADDECSAGFRCRDAHCLPGARSSTGGSCLVDGDCLEGDRCTAGYCTHFCATDGSCTEGFLCEASLCTLAAGRVALGGRCETDAQCVSGECRDAAGERICTVACGGAGPCPPGLRCERTGEALLCVDPSRTEQLGGGGCAVTNAARRRPADAAFALFVTIAVARRSRSRSRSRARRRRARG